MREKVVVLPLEQIVVARLLLHSLALGDRLVGPLVEVLRVVWEQFVGKLLPVFLVEELFDPFLLLFSLFP